MRRRHSPDEKSKLKIIGVRLVKTEAANPAPAYKPAPGPGRRPGGSGEPDVDLSRYKATRSCFSPIPARCPSFTVEITTDKGIKGYGSGGPGAGYVVEEHLTKLLLNEDPFDVERLWDIMWRSTMSYGRKGVVIHAISGVDLALWDIIGKALDMPVYKLLGGETKQRIPAYCTGNDIEQHVEVRVQAAEARDSTRARRRPRRHAEERRTGEARAQGVGSGWRHHARLLDGVDGTLHGRNCGYVRALPRLLDGRVPASRTITRALDA